MSVFRVYIEKKKEYSVEADLVLSDLKSAFGLKGLKRVRILNRYDTQRILEEDFEAAKMTVFGEPQVDVSYDRLPQTDGCVFAIEYLPGQYDQRADSAAQCIQLQTQKERPIVRAARVYILEGEVSAEELKLVKEYLINPVDSREASLETPDSLEDDFPAPEDIASISGFCSMNKSQLENLISQSGFAMDIDDLSFCQNYFKSEDRDPTFTELKVIDTYWSDHCRHTTFHTHLEHIGFEHRQAKDAFDLYLSLREELNRNNRPITLMDIATIGAKALKKRGLLNSLDESEEINACSVRIDVDINGETQPWLLMFKNETHNHPTEIEPFGGAATCLGGAIRDPLSGRSYVYQAMRLSGAADPLLPISKTMPGKLPQRKLVTQAAAGYSSYGNQIGLSTGLVREIYHPGYVAKRLEVGAVIAATPAENVIRLRPEPGDVIILLGGKTGRDGCGGATGSSKAHSSESLNSCGAEVQKGNPPEERKIQRLFRNSEAAKMIKRCNDFGAGGVSVAIGELADGIFVNLDSVPKKYEGLDGTELAISESQERMAVVLDVKNVSRFLEIAAEENLMGTQVAEVTGDNRMRMTWRNKTIVDLSRDFLNTNGAPKSAQANITSFEDKQNSDNKNGTCSFEERLNSLVSDLNVCSQKGLIERFDSSIGAATVLSPFGGTYQETPMQAMAAKIPLINSETDTASLMSYGFDPFISERDPYSGAVIAVCESIERIVAAGGSRKKCWLSFQEYFEKLRNDDKRWGKPLAALLGALCAQLELECAAIGGKDSMSGSFENIDVPPTFISFSVSTANASEVLSSEFKKQGSTIALLSPSYDDCNIPNISDVKKITDQLEALISAKKVRSAWVTSIGGVMEGLFKMTLGNRLGISIDDSISDDLLFSRSPCAIIIECDELPQGAVSLGTTTDSFSLIRNKTTYNLEQVFNSYAEKLASVFPYRIDSDEAKIPTFDYNKKLTRPSPAIKIAKPTVLIPAFAGTNCEYDTARQFELAGASVKTLIIRNLSVEDIDWSVKELERLIKECNILAIPGGFSGGDEPEGSGKFITAFFRNPLISEAVSELLNNRDGLMLGICNGFQALVKLGLVPYGQIVEAASDSPTLTFNRVGRHQSKLVNTRVCSTLSPWMMYNNVGDIHTVPISHGEGRFVAPPEVIKALAENGQIATQYVGLDGNPSMNTEYNPNYSDFAIEGISSPDGRVFAKMGHSERIGKNVHKNIPGSKDQLLFKAAVDYFAK